MQEKFCGFYLPSSGGELAFSPEGRVVLDANVLLNAYRYSPEVRKIFFSVLRALGDRVWVPYYAALEFQRNRLTVIAGQKKLFRDAMSSVGKKFSELELTFDDLGRHSAVDPEQLKALLRPSIEQIKTELKDRSQNYIDVFDTDPIRSEMDGILNGKIGPQPSDQKTIEAWDKEAQDRYQCEIPPGYLYLDKKSKLKDYCYADRKYVRSHGDYYIWKEILEISAKEKWRHVTFVSDDAKGDWWWIEYSDGDKTIGPRPELIEEAKRTAKIDVFQMYKSARFLELAAKYLDVELSEAELSQAKRAGIDRESAGDKFGARAKKAVLQWLLSIEGIEAVHPIGLGGDFTAFGRDGELIIVEIKMMTGVAGVSRRLRESVKEVELIFREHPGFDRAVLVLAFWDFDGALDALPLVSRFTPRIDPRIEVTVGVVLDGEEFIPLGLDADPSVSPTSGD